MQDMLGVCRPSSGTHMLMPFLHQGSDSVSHAA
jgi:hypothetical protein